MAEGIAHKPSVNAPPSRVRTQAVQFSIIVPALNEAAAIAVTLAKLAPLRSRGIEVIVVDGRSQDNTAEIAAAHADRVIVAARGRAAQMNAGARVARGEVLLFLHADSLLPDDADGIIARALDHRGRQWGRFDVRLSGQGWALHMIETMMNWRSRVTGIATGDQGMFVRRDAFELAGGFPEIALMEDIALSSRLRRHGRPACLRDRIVTSSRRWENAGVLRTIALMWFLRLAFFLGVDPTRLARIYYGR